jgi:glycosyltransferase involved in cell wall biosynthesis
MPGVTVRTLLQVPAHGSAWARRLNRWLLRWQVRRALRRHDHVAPLISWFVAPHASSLIGTLGEDLSVYYCVDDFSVFAGVNGDAVRAMDEHLTRHADLVFVSSATLESEKRLLAPRVHHAPHGVDVQHFRTATARPVARPNDLPDKGPIIGYFGLVAEWIDLELIDRLAAKHPDWQFVMIGRIAVPESRLPVRSNVHILGPKPYQDLPKYGAWFDVAIIPYLLTPQVLRANPIKLREYIAMEKPIVAVDTPDIRALLPLVTIASDEASWSEALRAALESREDHARAASQREAADQMSWDRRMSQVESLVLARLGTRDA